ncbi:MAG: orotate phosphoribosyltransferase [Capsulimonadales bacterium]|nr:orotate phosphoribosyltransferase [Capsulimonadales bacterium]
MTDSDILNLFENSGALLTGHFILTSGKHSDRYFEKFNVLNQPWHVETLCRELAARSASLAPDVVLGPTTLGVLLAYEVAKHLGVPAAYGEKGADGKRFLRRPEHLRSGQRVLVVDDVLTTGGSVRECIDLVTSAGGQLCGVGLLIDRSGGTVDFGVPTIALLPLKVEAYDPDAVPDWLNRVPVTRPGSTGKK